MPGSLTRTVERSTRAVWDYIEEVRRVDIQRVDGVVRAPEKVGRLLVALARNVATEATVATLSTDAGGGDGALGP